MDLAETCSRRLGAIVVAAILHGSLALGDYVPEQSDIDLLLIVDRPLSDPEIETLVHAVLGTRKRAALRVDLRVITKQIATAPPRCHPWSCMSVLACASG
jgi:predicted nucleotidyltransferase